MAAPSVELMATRGRKAWRLLRRPALWRSVRFGVVPSLEHVTVPFGSRYGTVFDVGASRGQFAAFARHRWRGAQLVCFEPLPEAAATLRRIVPTAQIHDVAVGSPAQRATFHVSANDDSSSLLAIGPRQQAEFAGTQPAATITVEVQDLARHLRAEHPRPWLLKIDVQGGELDVLRSAGEALTGVDDILVEASFAELYEGQALVDEVLALTREQGFALAGVFNLVRGREGTALQADFLLRRRERSP